MFRFVILAAFLATAYAGDVATRCANAGELPISFEVEGCSSAPCSLPQLEDAVFKVKFNARDSSALQARLVGILLGIISVPFDLGADAQACSGLVNASCPVKEGQELDYTLKIPIEPFFPIGTSMVVEISVQDDSGSPAFCARVPIVVTAPRN